jgi:hypothetical protein
MKLNKINMINMTNYQISIRNSNKFYSPINLTLISQI